MPNAHLVNDYLIEGQTVRSFHQIKYAQKLGKNKFSMQNNVFDVFLNPFFGFNLLSIVSTIISVQNFIPHDFDLTKK